MSKYSNLLKLFTGLVILMGIFTTLFLTRTISAANKVTICHAAGSATNPFNRLVVNENAISGHFENNGTPKAGHEDDLLFQGEVDCPSGTNPSPSPSVIVSPSPSVNVSPSVSPSPSVVVSVSPSPTPSPSVSPSPSPVDPCEDCSQGDPDPSPSLSPSPSASASANSSTSPSPAPSSSSSSSSSNSSSSSSDSSNSSNGDVQGASTQGEVLGISTMAPTGSTEDFMSLIFWFGIVLIGLSYRSYAQQKA